MDESALTGESIPVEKTAGDTVNAATVNRTGSFTFRATRVGADTSLAKIIQLVEDANATKAPIARTGRQGRRRVRARGIRDLGRDLCGVDGADQQT